MTLSCAGDQSPNLMLLSLMTLAQRAISLRKNASSRSGGAPSTSIPLLTCRQRPLLAEYARNLIDRAARREDGDQLDRLRRPALRHGASDHTQGKREAQRSGPDAARFHA